MLHEDPSPSIQGRACHQEPAPASPSPTQPLLQGNEDLSLPRHLRRFLTLKSVRLIAFTLLMVVFAVISAVWRKKLMTAYGVRYVFFRQELTNLLYNIWASLIVIYKLIFTDHITKEMRAFPIWKFAILSFFDGLADFMSSVGGIYTPGEWQVILNQSVIVFTAVFSIFILRARYNWKQCIGITVLIAGTALAILPLLIHPSDVKSMIWYFVLAYTLSNAPAALSYTIKESFFKAHKIDVFWLTTLVSWIQLGVTWLFVPLLSLKIFGGLKISGIPEIFRDGFLCFIGDRSVPVYNELNQIVGHCSPDVTLITFVYSIAGFIQGILLLFLVSEGSALFSLIAAAIALPLSNLAFELPFVMGIDAEAFSYYNLSGLALVVLGFILYSIFSRKRAKPLDDIEPAV